MIRVLIRPLPRLLTLRAKEQAVSARIDGAESCTMMLEFGGDKELYFATMFHERKPSSFQQLR